MKTMVNIKMDKDLKEQASALANELGFNLSSVVSATLKNFVRTREINVSLDPVMTPYLEKVIEESEKEFKKEKVKTFSSAKDAKKFLMEK